MAALLALWSADIVLVNILGVFGPADAAQMMGVPVVWAVHESYALDAFARVSVGQSGVAAEVRERWLGALANSELIFVSTATADLLRAELEGSRARVLRYGVDVAGIERFVQSHDRAAMRAELGYGAEDLVLLSIGVMGSRKGVLQLISAFQSVATAYPRAHLVLVGADEDDAYTAAVLTFVEALGLGDRVRVVPLTTDTYPWYFVCDLLVSASDNESLPRSMIEALAFSRPIAAAEVFGVGELVKSGATGWLFAPNDRDSLATALKLALSAPAEELALMGAQAHDKAADFHSEELVGEIRRLIDGACRACDVRVL
jgi:glycosyltransferase involved in cell wall biosynthesis